MQMYINYCCNSMKQREGLGNGGNALPHHTHGHAPSLSPSHTCNKLPGMKYRLAARKTPTVTAETMPGANYITDDIRMKT